MKNSISLFLLGCLFLPSLSHATEVSFEEDHSLPIVEINVAIKSGAASDPDTQLGVTNFMGEMLLRGTRLRNKEQIDIAIDQMGAQLAVETRSESMILRGAVLSSQLDNFLSLLNEVLTQPTFPDLEIAHLKTEVVSEILGEMGSDRELAGRKFTEYLFENHPYGKPIIGKSTTVNKLTHTQILNQYNAIVNEQQLLVVGAGDADNSRIQEWAEKLGKSLGTHSGKPPMKIEIPKNLSHRELVIVDKPARTQTQITAGQIGVTLTDPAFFSLYLGNHAFGGGSFSARMMQEIRVKRGWSYGAYSYFRHATEPRSWQFYLFPAAKDTPDALALSLKLVEDVKEKGVTQAEFDLAQKSLINSSGFMYDTPTKRVENKLIERTLNLPDGFMKSYGPKLSEVTLPQVNSSLHDFLKPDHLMIVVVGTASELKDKLATAAGVPVDQVKVIPYTEE
jgi:zinc protease